MTKKRERDENSIRFDLICYFKNPGGPSDNSRTNQ